MLRYECEFWPLENNIIVINNFRFRGNRVTVHGTRIFYLTESVSISFKFVLVSAYQVKAKDVSTFSIFSFFFLFHFYRPILAWRIFQRSPSLISYPFLHNRIRVMIDVEAIARTKVYIGRRRNRKQDRYNYAKVVVSWSNYVLATGYR